MSPRHSPRRTSRSTLRTAQNSFSRSSCPGPAAHFADQVLHAVAQGPPQVRAVLLGDPLHPYELFLTHGRSRTHSFDQDGHGQSEKYPAQHEHHHGGSQDEQELGDHQARRSGQPGPPGHDE
jgi:hypothetical protein